MNEQQIRDLISALERIADAQERLVELVEECTGSDTRFSYENRKHIRIRELRS